MCGISGLRAADVEVRVDGDPRTNFSYDANSGALSLAGGRMMEGRHSVKITAADTQELTTSKRSALQPVSQRAPSADGALLVLLVWSFCRSCLRSLCRPADRLGPYVDAAVYVEGLARDVVAILDEVADGARDLVRLAEAPERDGLQ